MVLMKDPFGQALVVGAVPEYGSVLHLFFTSVVVSTAIVTIVILLAPLMLMNGHLSKLAKNSSMESTITSSCRAQNKLVKFTIYNIKAWAK